VFNLVKYRYLFLLFSGLIIVPGLISLIIFQLNVGSDFTGGSSLQLRPQTAISNAQIQKSLAPFKLQDLQINTGQNTQLDPKKIFWVRLNTQVDSNVENTIKSNMTGKFPGVTIDLRTIPASGGQKAFTLVTISSFKTVPQESDVRAALNNLPKTSDPTKPADTTAAAATATPQATGTAAAKTTPKVVVPATATATVAAASSNPANIPVSIQDIKQGSTAQTVTILTRTLITSNAAKNQISPEQIQAALISNGGTYTQMISNASTGPAIAADTTRNAVLAVLAASALILLYIWFAFRKVPKAFRYGTCAIIALLHDVLVVLGIFSILGVLFNIQIDALFITGLLTVVGFSVHDTIVVFDRIRENLLRRTTETFEQVVNASLVQTMARSLNTSLTVLFTLLALTLFTGIGTTIHTFTLTLLIGIASGTYSSIFNASMLLVIWENGELGFGRLGGNREPQFPTRRGREERELARSRG
jgi:preprotein translocase SecF subunit